MNQDQWERIIIFFAAYSIIGAFLDIGYASMKAGEFTLLLSTGTIFGPSYGIGVLIILFLKDEIKKFSLLGEFFSYGLFLAAWEYCTGWLAVNVRGVRFHDYSDSLLNLHGHTDIEHFIIFGVLGMLFVYHIHPHIRPYLFKFINSPESQTYTSPLPPIPPPKSLVQG
jgi:uncharacterized membrane protein